MARNYGNQQRRHGNVWYAGKYAARGLGAYGAYVSHLGSTKWGWKKGGKMYKRVLGGIGGPRRRLGSNRPAVRHSNIGSNPSRNSRTGSNPGRRLGSNPSRSRPGVSSSKFYAGFAGGSRSLIGKRAFKRTYSK